MPEKTTVTNASVSESEESQSQKSQSDAGKSPSEKEIENRVRENLRGEYERKSSEMAEKLSDAESRIAELEESASLTKSQQDELNALHGDKDNLEDEIRQLESKKEFRPYMVKVAREAEKAKNEAIVTARFEMSQDQMKIYIADKAEAEGISYDEMYAEITKSLADKYVKNLLPAERARVGFQERAKKKAEEKREANLKEREARLENFSETGQRKVREPSLQEAKQSGDTIAQAKALGL